MCNPRWSFIGSIVWAMIAPAVCLAQFPYEGVVAVERGSLQVRSGPSENHYRTGILQRGDRVNVVGEAPDGWLKIEPPADSFSWIAGEFVRRISGSEGEVMGQQVRVRVGTRINEDLREEVQVQLSRGDRVRIIDQKTSGSGALAKLWYKIAPPAGEVRYVNGQYIVPADGRRSGMRANVKGSGVKGDDFQGAESGSSSRGSFESEAELNRDQADSDAAPASRAPADLLDRADAAYKAELGKNLADRDFATALALYQQAAESTRNGSDQVHIARRLDEIQEQQARKARLEELQRIVRRSKERDQVLLSMTRNKDNPQRPASPRYDGSGVLRKSAVTIDGKPAYVLLSPQGGIRYYVTAAPGMDVSEYVDQTVAVRGPVSYRSEVRAQHILVRDITPIDVPQSASETRTRSRR